MLKDKDEYITRECGKDSTGESSIWNSESVLHIRGIGSHTVPKWTKHHRRHKSPLKHRQRGHAMGDKPPDVTKNTCSVPTSTTPSANMKGQVLVSQAAHVSRRRQLSNPGPLFQDRYMLAARNSIHSRPTYRTRLVHFLFCCHTGTRYRTWVNRNRAQGGAESRKGSRNF